MARVDARQTAAAWFEAYRAERDRADRAEAALATGCSITTVVDPVGGPVAAPCAIDGCQYARAELDAVRADRDDLQAMATANKIVRLSFAGAVRHADERAARAEATLVAIRAGVQQLEVFRILNGAGGHLDTLSEADVLALLDAAPKETP